MCRPGLCRSVSRHSGGSSRLGIINASVLTEAYSRGEIQLVRRYQSKGEDLTVEFKANLNVYKQQAHNFQSILVEMDDCQRVYAIPFKL